jgi:hypothetical protein
LRKALYAFIVSLGMIVEFWDTYHFCEPDSSVSIVSRPQGGYPENGGFNFWQGQEIFLLTISRLALGPPSLLANGA